jgi:TctA family transporter
LVVVSIGLFAIGEVLVNLNKVGGDLQILGGLRNLLPTFQDLKDSRRFLNGPGRLFTVFSGAGPPLLRSCLWREKAFSRRAEVRHRRHRGGRAPEGANNSRPAARWFLC